MVQYNSDLKFLSSEFTNGEIMNIIEDKNKILNKYSNILSSKFSLDEIIDILDNKDEILYKILIKLKKEYLEKLDLIVVDDGNLITHYQNNIKKIDEILEREKNKQPNVKYVNNLLRNYGRR